MEEKLMFCLNSILFGIGLAMDAFSVSMANGLHEPRMKTGRMCLIAGTFGVFQFAMPMIGWFCVHTVAETFKSFQKFIPWIALILLAYIGGKMFYEGITNTAGAEAREEVSGSTLLIQGIATSIDALSVGFTISSYTAPEAFAESCIIGVVTFFISLAGIKIGKVVGMKLSGKADMLGGIILIAIGLEIFIRSML